MYANRSIQKLLQQVNQEITGSLSQEKDKIRDASSSLFKKNDKLTKQHLIDANNLRDDRSIQSALKTCLKTINQKLEGR